MTIESKIAKPRHDERRFKVHEPSVLGPRLGSPAFNTTFLPLESLLRKN